VAVRELCEFTAKQGDLDLRFTPAPSALEGMAGHALAAARRGAGYVAELSLSGVYRPSASAGLRVRGRADGFDPAAGRLDEVKTFKGRLERQPPSHRALHWAQALIYGHLLCETQQRQVLDIALVYVDVGSHQETVLTRHCSAAELRQHFELHCRRYLDWAMQEQTHRLHRDAAMQILTFGFEGFRVGQRPLAEAVYRSASSGRVLMAQAPTGIGKTWGTLFPLLKAMPKQGLDKVFFLSAKTSGRQPPMQALSRLKTGATLRVLELVAREKTCEHPELACHGDSCPLARGFYDRLPGARAHALAKVASAAPEAPLALDQTCVREIALQHTVCPYYLSQELTRWADVIVADYNHYFDANAMLYALAQANDWRVAVLVDEAHNLVERARKMYSAELRPQPLALALKSDTARGVAGVRRALNGLRRQWRMLEHSQAAPYQVHEPLPEPLLGALQACTGAISEHQAEHPTVVDPSLTSFYFEALQFGRLMETLGAHSITDLSLSEATTPRGIHSIISVRNLVPAPFLAPRFEAAHTTTLFSATLQPPQFHSDLLGLPKNVLTLDVESPFEATQLQVHTARDISTRYADRTASLAPLVDRMAVQFEALPGNYLAFFSSYAYLDQAADLMARRHPGLPLWRQARGMDEGAQREFLERFTPDSQGIGFAVLGGAFSEGIDLPGRRLIGAFLATLGLPQINDVNEQVRQRMQAMFGAGHDYTYLYPGLQKVVQAAGRVIRSPQDRGVLHLMDDRYGQARIRALLPRWWRYND
jgi:Rad3-related DNA helicase